MSSNCRMRVASVTNVAPFILGIFLISITFPMKSTLKRDHYSLFLSSSTCSASVVATLHFESRQRAQPRHTTLTHPRPHNPPTPVQGHLIIFYKASEFTEPLLSEPK
ncbi:hypothetical protein QBC34DRAFT_9233 [Podospora aff. communis PSN243]|uniref:Uncharacterized protein n=1 Tax=Podospora aff. communis PSN243 TaxID=3040156 RepID=A0AAV9H5Y9_9PEZI|nr:hypothetical protein QBC34DRAFT_9233 [Podospora aff. communis PSN243]